MQHHTRPDLPTPVESFPTDPTGLPEAGRPALLGFVNDDAAYLADRIATRHQAAMSANAGVTKQPSS